MNDIEVLKSMLTCIGTDCIGCRCLSEDGTECLQDDDDEIRALTHAIALMKKEEKYRWHDLRKDPKDLPRSGTDVQYLVLAKYDRKKQYITSRFYGYGESCHGNVEFPLGLWEANESGMDVIAWREIEPLEEE